MCELFYDSNDSAPSINGENDKTSDEESDIDGENSENENDDNMDEDAKPSIIGRIVHHNRNLVFGGDINLDDAAENEMDALERVTEQIAKEAKKSKRQKSVPKNVSMIHKQKIFSKIFSSATDKRKFVIKIHFKICS